MTPTNSAINTTTSPMPQSGLPQSYYIILGILGSLAVIFNGVLLYVLWRTKSPEFRLGTSYVIGNLALADCLTGVAVLFYVTRYEALQKYQLPMVWTTIEASLMSLMFLSVERILAFQYPFASRSIVTVKRTITVITVIWIFAITCGIFVHFSTLTAQLVMTIIFEFCVVVFLASQGYIIVKIQQRKRGHLFCDRDLSLKTRKYLHRQRMNDRVTKVVFILIIVVVVTLLPYMIGMQIFFLHILKLIPPLRSESFQILDNFLNYYYPIELLNFIVNPIIYAYRLQRYRTAFFNAFSFIKYGPFSKERARTFSGSSNDSQPENTQKMLMIKHDGNFNSVQPTRC